MRGQVDGRPIRRCLECGAGLAVLMFGRARLIPEPIWDKMKAEWERNFGPSEPTVRQVIGDTLVTMADRDPQAGREDIERVRILTGATNRTEEDKFRRLLRNVLDDEGLAAMTAEYAALCEKGELTERGEWQLKLLREECVSRGFPEAG